ncbi:hypothetical protein ACVWZ8_003145 [Arthrobacter sp. UYCu723]
MEKPWAAEVDPRSSRTRLGRIPANATLKERMARKLKTKRGRAVYARRKAIAEPVFGQIHTRQRKHVLLRGLEQAVRELGLLAGCHNLLIPLFWQRPGPAWIKYSANA